MHVLTGIGTATTGAREARELELDSVIEEWEQELTRTNDGKNGEPYRHPGSCIRFLAFVRLLFRMTYRETRVRALPLQARRELKAPDYSTIERRTNKLDVRLDESLSGSSFPATIAVDSSGIKVHNGGDWIRHVWKVKRVT